jgi:hypothetical protein
VCANAKNKSEDLLNYSFFHAFGTKSLKGFIYLNAKAICGGLAIGGCGLREPPGGPEGVRSTEPKANPVRWRPRRGHAQILNNKVNTKSVGLGSCLFFID